MHKTFQKNLSGVQHIRYYYYSMYHHHLPTTPFKRHEYRGHKKFLLHNSMSHLIEGKKCAKLLKILFEVLKLQSAIVSINCANVNVELKVQFVIFP